jgi:hypothetical protein
MENNTKIRFEKLWTGLGKFPECEICDKDCKGLLDYNDLCGNVNYLKNYAEKNFEKNNETFIELKKIMDEEKPSIFSFGCGLGLECFGARECFGERVIYYPIEECKWAIMDTLNYKNFEPKLPRIINFDNGMVMLEMTSQNPVLCFLIRYSRFREIRQI